MPKNPRRRRHRRDPRRLLLPAAVALVLIVVLAIWLWPDNIADEITVEAGETVSAQMFLIEDEGEPVSFVTDLSTIDFAVPGDYDVKLSYKGRIRKSTILVRDTVKPTGTARNLAAYTDKAPDPGDFVTSVEDVTQVTISYLEEPDMTRAGSQLVTILLTDAGGNATRLHAVLTVFVDKEAPVISGVAPLYTCVDREPDYWAGVTVTDDQDLNPASSVDTGRVDLNTPGTYEITYDARDRAGNITTVASTLTVTDDNVGPEIFGAKNLTVYQGFTTDYLEGVTAVDEKDPAPVLTADDSQVDLSAQGIYLLTYIATDRSGNVTKAQVTVTVTAAPAGFVPEETIFRMADNLLAQIIKEEMTVRQQCQAIYDHMRSAYQHAGRSDRTNWLQTACAMMEDGQGDSYGYFALSKLLLERLEIPTIDVTKVKTYDGDSEHFWSLVSPDGGKTYYHFDTTPQMGSGDDFCLVTDAFLDAYSASHNDSHNRDRSLYPATPET